MHCINIRDLESIDSFTLVVLSEELFDLVGGQTKDNRISQVAIDSHKILDHHLQTSKPVPLVSMTDIEAYVCITAFVA